MTGNQSKSPFALNEMDVRAWWNAMSAGRRLEKITDLSLAESQAWSGSWEELGQQRRWMLKEALTKVTGTFPAE